MRKLTGVGTATGVAMAKAFIYSRPNVKILSKALDQKQDQHLKNAIESVVKDLKELSQSASEETKNIIAAQIQIVLDPVMEKEMLEIISTQKVGAAFAVTEVMQKYQNLFQNLEDPYLKQRASDVKDVSQRLIYALTGRVMPSLSKISEDVIIVTDDLSPSDTVQLNLKHVKGFATDIGGPTSHSVIIAKSSGITAVVGLKTITTIIKNGDYLLIDGNKGVVIINPTECEIEPYKNQLENINKLEDDFKKFVGQKTRTADGHKLKLGANIASTADLVQVAKNGAEGIGLFRSEFLYMDKPTWPSEEKQFQAYKKALMENKSQTVVVRTMDIGGDKQLDYFNFPDELNPFLGYRAIRMSLDLIQVFKVQLRALIRASAYGKLAIMFPMIATIDELLSAKAIYQEVKKDLGQERVKIEIGIMIEVPSAAVMASSFAEHVDFFSIGTNDLMQYTMAADRMNPKVAHLYQPFNPAILKMINFAIQGGHSKKIWVGICGEMGGDLDILPILIGLGIDELSMSPAQILPARALVKKLNYKKVKHLAKKALTLQSADEVKEFLRKTNFKDMS